MNIELIRGLHIIAVIAWMAGLMMLPRLYAYQCESQAGGELETKMIEAARRLRVLILTPSLLIAFLLGLNLFYLRVGAAAPPLWLVLKIALALALAALHGYFAAAGRKLAKGERVRDGRFWRMIGEAPMILAILIVLLAVLEPRFG